jgi:hypothetical protein
MNFHGCMFPADGANLPASSIRLIMLSGSGSFLKARMLRRSIMTFSTGFHGIPSW